MKRSLERGVHEPSRLRFVAAALLALLVVATAVRSAVAGDAVAEPDESAYALSLREAEAVALGHSYALKSELTKTDVAEARIQSAYGEILPIVASEFQQTRVSGEANAAQGAETPIDTQSAYVTLQQPLFKGGKVGAAIRGARDYRSFTAEQIRAKRQEVLFDVRTQYLAVLFAAEQVRVNEIQVGLAEESLSDARKRRRLEVATELEVLRWEVQLANQQAVLIQSQNDLRTEEATLLRLLGLPLDAELRLTDALAMDDLRIAGDAPLYDLALRTHPNIRMARLSEEMKREEITVTRARLQPQVSLQGRYGGKNTSWSWDAEDWKEDWLVGLRLEWLLFDGMAIRGRVNQQRAELEGLRYDRKDLAEAIRLGVRNALLSLRSAREFVASQQANVAQAERVLRQEQARETEGAGTYLDVLNAREDLAAAQKNYNQALYNFGIARASLAYALGILGETPLEAAVADEAEAGPDAGAPRPGAQDVGDAEVGGSARIHPAALRRVNRIGGGGESARENSTLPDMPATSSPGGAVARPVLPVATDCLSGVLLPPPPGAGPCGAEGDSPTGE
jgi:outer membrane protein TolC